jgi:hypothetical protein
MIVETGKDSVAGQKCRLGHLYTTAVFFLDDMKVGAGRDKTQIPVGLIG